MPGDGIAGEGRGDATARSPGSRRLAFRLAFASLLAHLLYASFPAARAARLPMDEGVYRELAAHLATEGRLYLGGDAFQTVVAGQPTLFWTPGYPLLLAGVVKSGLPFLATLSMIQILLIAALPLVLRPLAARLLSGRPLAAFLALVVFYPYHFPLAIQVGSEALAAFLAAASLGLAASEGKGRLARAAGSGLLASALALTRPEYLAFAAVLGAWWASRELPAFPRRSAFAAMAYALAFAALAAPWMLRNHAVAGRWIFTTRSGYSLVFQNEYYHALSRGYAGDEASWWSSTPVYPGEMERYAYLKARGRAFLRAHPGVYARLCAKRLVSLVAPLSAKRALARAFGRGDALIPSPPLWHRFSNGAFLLLAWAGAIIALGRHRGRLPIPAWGTPAGLLAGIVAGQCAVYVALAYIEYQRSLLDPEILLLIAWAAFRGPARQPGRNVLK